MNEFMGSQRVGHDWATELNWTDEWILLSAATWMDLENIKFSEVSQRKRNTLWFNLHVESKWYYRWMDVQNRSRFTVNSPFLSPVTSASLSFFAMLILSSLLSKSLLPFSPSHFFSSFHISSYSLLSFPSPFLSSFHLPMFEIKWISELFWSVVFHYS